MGNKIVDKNVIEEINKCCREAGMFGLQNVVYILYNDHIKLQEAQANEAREAIKAAQQGAMKSIK